MSNSKVTGRIFSAVAALMLVAPVCAQKPEKMVRAHIGQARAYIKSGKDYDKAERLMTDLLKDSANRENIKIVATWFDAVKGQYEAANEKLYLKQKYDTAAFYQLMRHMEDVAFRLDTLDARPDGKGRVRPTYRKTNAELLRALRPNIYYGGTWHVRKADYRAAFDFFDDYLQAPLQPLYADYHYEQTDTMLQTAAYWATYCGYKMQDADRMLKYCKRTQSAPATEAFGIQCEAYAHHLRSASAPYADALRRGYEAYPLHPYFFPRLADFYAEQGRNDSVLVIANRGLEVNDSNMLFLLAKSVALLNLERYDDCIETSLYMLQLNDTMPEPHFNIATCYLNRALAVEQQNQPRRNRQRLRDLYKSAQPYMEDYRRLAPNDKQRWAPALYRIYLNLNMGKQFEEIDRLMHQ